ncbi:hypothetical protein ABI59_21230 [Acidobacteria bacterium Mor1]|nr:hypothetical protein ABI59_21230 [Acidobacteria bacterium Mor1]
MRILYTSLAYPPSIGGGEIHLHRLVREMSRRGADVQVICQWSRSRSDWLRGSTTEADPPLRYEHDGVPVNRLGFDDATKARMRPWTSLYRQRPLRGLAIRRLAGLLAPFYRAAVDARPDLVHILRMGCEHLPQAARQYAEEQGIPWVVTPLHHPGWDGGKYRHYDRIFRAADGVIALTESERETLIRSKGVAAEKVHVTGIGPILDDNGFAVGSAVNPFAQRGVNAPYVLFLGRKAGYKGWDTLLDAAPAILERHPDARIVFAGPDTPESTARFDACDDPRIVNLGEVDLPGKTALLAGCALLALPSTAESFGGVFTEAWACGRPVVGVGLPSVACVVDHETDGLLIEPAAAPLADAVSRLLGDPAAADRMGQAGREKVRSRFSWERLAERTAEVYEAASRSR